MTTATKTKVITTNIITVVTQICLKIHQLLIVAQVVIVIE